MKRHTFILLFAIVCIAASCKKKSINEDRFPAEEDITTESTSSVDEMETSSQQDSLAMELPTREDNPNYSYKENTLVAFLPLTVPNSPENPALKKLGLPDYYTQRIFMKDASGYISLEGVSKLVGTVFLKKIVNNKDIYEETGLNFTKDGFVVVPKAPEKKELYKYIYNSDISANLKYLISNVDFTKNAAYEVYLADVAEAKLEAKNIDLKRLYSTYNNERNKDDYYIILSAVSTSISYSAFSKANRNADLSVSGIGFGGKYYTGESAVSQDWKVGFRPVKIAEILKGYSPEN